MNEGSEAIELTGTKKKRRRSGLRFSSRKVLERTRLKRETAKSVRCQEDSVRKALSYPSERCGIDVCSSIPQCLDSVLEHEGARLDLTFGNANIQESICEKISN